MAPAQSTPTLLPSQVPAPEVLTPGAEVIHGPWRSFEAVEFATLEWVDWFNNRRLLEPIGNIPPAEATTPCWNNQPWRRDSNEMASDKPGALHGVHPHSRKLK